MSGGKSLTALGPDQSGPSQRPADNRVKIFNLNQCARRDLTYPSQWRRFYVDVGLGGASNYSEVALANAIWICVQE